jgi:hypothetical protein
MVDEPNECEAVRVTMCVCGFFFCGLSQATTPREALGEGGCVRGRSRNKTEINAQFAQWK